MELDAEKILMAAFIASIAWFFAGSILYMNPYVAQTYRLAMKEPGVRKWMNSKQFVGFQYLGILAQSILAAIVFSIIKPVMPEQYWHQVLFFGLILIAIKIFPRWFDMWIQSTYPKRLLYVEFVNGSLLSMVASIVFAYFL
jgi:hypothetical protein